MPLVIPPTYANFHLTLTNSAGGASGKNGIAIGIKRLINFAQSDVDRIANLMRDGLKGLYDSSWTLGPVHVNDNQAGVHLVWDAAVTEAGTLSAFAQVPPAVALVVSKQTGLSGKAHRGRLYMPGLAEGSVDEAGIVNSGLVGTWQAAFNALIISLVADAAIDELALFHDSATPGGLDPDTINTFVVRNVVGNMRPRQRR